MILEFCRLREASGSRYLSRSDGKLEASSCGLHRKRVHRPCCQIRSEDEKVFQDNKPTVIRENQKPYPTRTHKELLEYRRLKEKALRKKLLSRNRIRRMTEQSEVADKTICSSSLRMTHSSEKEFSESRSLQDSRLLLIEKPRVNRRRSIPDLTGIKCVSSSEVYESVASLSNSNDANNFVLVPSIPNETTRSRKYKNIDSIVSSSSHSSILEEKWTKNLSNTLQKDTETILQKTSLLNQQRKYSSSDNSTETFNAKKDSKNFTFNENRVDVSVQTESRPKTPHVTGDVASQLSDHGESVYYDSLEEDTDDSPKKGNVQAFFIDFAGRRKCMDNVNTKLPPRLSVRLQELERLKVERRTKKISHHSPVISSDDVKYYNEISYPYKNPTGNQFPPVENGGLKEYPEDLTSQQNKAEGSLPAISQTGHSGILLKKDLRSVSSPFEPLNASKFANSIVCESDDKDSIRSTFSEENHTKDRTYTLSSEVTPGNSLEMMSSLPNDESNLVDEEFVENESNRVSSGFSIYVEEADSSNPNLTEEMNNSIEINNQSSNSGQPENEGSDQSSETMLEESTMSDTSEFGADVLQENFQEVNVKLQSESEEANSSSSSLSLDSQVTRRDYFLNNRESDIETDDGSAGTESSDKITVIAAGRIGSSRSQELDSPLENTDDHNHITEQNDSTEDVNESEVDRSLHETVDLENSEIHCGDKDIIDAHNTVNGKEILVATGDSDLKRDLNQNQNQISLLDEEQSTSNQIISFVSQEKLCEEFISLSSSETPVSSNKITREMAFEDGEFVKYSSEEESVPLAIMDQNQKVEDCGSSFTVQYDHMLKDSNREVDSITELTRTENTSDHIKSESYNDEFIVTRHTSSKKLWSIPEANSSDSDECDTHIDSKEKSVCDNLGISIEADQSGVNDSEEKSIQHEINFSNDATVNIILENSEKKTSELECLQTSHQVQKSIVEPHADVEECFVTESFDGQTSETLDILKISDQEVTEVFEVNNLNPEPSYYTCTTSGNMNSDIASSNNDIDNTEETADMKPMENISEIGEEIVTVCKKRLQMVKMKISESLPISGILDEAEDELVLSTHESSCRANDSSFSPELKDRVGSESIKDNTNLEYGVQKEESICYFSVHPMQSKDNVRKSDDITTAVSGELVPAEVCVNNLIITKDESSPSPDDYSKFVKVSSSSQRYPDCSEDLYEPNTVMSKTILNLEGSVTSTDDSMSSLLSTIEEEVEPSGSARSSNTTSEGSKTLDQCGTLESDEKNSIELYPDESKLADDSDGGITPTQATPEKVAKDEFHEKTGNSSREMTNIVSPHHLSNCSNPIIQYFSTVQSPSQDSRENGKNIFQDQSFKNSLLNNYAELTNVSSCEVNVNSDVSPNPDDIDSRSTIKESPNEDLPCLSLVDEKNNKSIEEETTCETSDYSVETTVVEHHETTITVQEVTESTIVSIEGENDGTVCNKGNFQNDLSKSVLLNANQVLTEKDESLDSSEIMEELSFSVDEDTKDSSAERTPRIFDYGEPMPDKIEEDESDSVANAHIISSYLNKQQKTLTVDSDMDITESNLYDLDSNEEKNINLSSETSKNTVPGNESKVKCESNILKRSNAIDQNPSGHESDGTSVSENKISNFSDNLHLKLEPIRKSSLIIDSKNCFDPIFKSKIIYRSSSGINRDSEQIDKVRRSSLNNDSIALERKQRPWSACTKTENLSSSGQPLLSKSFHSEIDILRLHLSEKRSTSNLNLRKERIPDIIKEISDHDSLQNSEGAGEDESNLGFDSAKCFQSRIYEPFSSNKVILPKLSSQRSDPRQKSSSVNSSSADAASCGSSIVSHDTTQPPTTSPSTDSGVVELVSPLETFSGSRTTSNLRSGEALKDSLKKKGRNLSERSHSACRAQEIKVSRLKHYSTLDNLEETISKEITSKHNHQLTYSWLETNYNSSNVVDEVIDEDEVFKPQNLVHKEINQRGNGKRVEDEASNRKLWEPCHPNLYNSISSPKEDGLASFNNNKADYTEEEEEEEESDFRQYSGGSEDSDAGHGLNSREDEHRDLSMKILKTLETRRNRRQRPRVPSIDTPTNPYKPASLSSLDYLLASLPQYQTSSTFQSSQSSRSVQQAIGHGNRDGEVMVQVIAGREQPDIKVTASRQVKLVVQVGEQDFDENVERCRDESVRRDDLRRGEFQWFNFYLP